MKPRPKLNPKRPSLGFKIHSGNLAGKMTPRKKKNPRKKVKEHLGDVTQPLSFFFFIIIFGGFFFFFSSLNSDYL